MSMAMRVYGLKNCDTCRKARRWLDENDIAHEFIDVRENTPALAEIRRWLTAAGEALLNRRGTTWRQLDDADKARAEKPSELPKLLQEHPSLMKRPVVVNGDTVSVGFDARQWPQQLR
jgi:arsenate reductase